MLTQLILARAALASSEPDMDRHAALQCRVGFWRRRVAAAAQWLKARFGAGQTRP